MQFVLLQSAFRLPATLPDGTGGVVQPGVHSWLGRFPIYGSSLVGGREVGTRPPVRPAAAIGRSNPRSLRCRSRRNHWRDQTADGARCTWRTKPGELSAGILLHLSFLVFCDGCCMVTDQVDTIGKRVQMPEQVAVALSDR